MWTETEHQHRFSVIIRHPDGKGTETRNSISDWIDPIPVGKTDLATDSADFSLVQRARVIVSFHMTLSNDLTENVCNTGAAVASE